MPRGDRTGPIGMGPMSGRGAGFCAGFAMAGFMNPGNASCGMGFGRGCGGWGFGRTHGFKGALGGAYFSQPAYQEPPAVNEKDYLSSQAKYLEKELQKVKKRLEAFDETEE